MIGEKAGDEMAAKICRILKIGQISLPYSQQPRPFGLFE